MVIIQDSRFYRIAKPLVGFLVGSLVLASASACGTTGSASNSNPAPAATSSAAAETNKINAKLLELERRVKVERQSLKQASASMAIVTSDRGVELDIVTSQLDESVEKQLAMPGVTLRHVSRKYNRVSATINDLSLLHELARIPQVVMISPQYPARTH